MLQISLSNPLRFMLLRTLPFSVYSVFRSKFFAFNRLRTLSQNRGVGINSSQSGTLAPSSTNHKSRITSHESRITPLECAVSTRQRVRIPSDQRELRDLSSHPARIGLEVWANSTYRKRGGSRPVVG